jgi:hypothetical protein
MTVRRVRGRGDGAVSNTNPQIDPNVRSPRSIPSSKRVIASSKPATDRSQLTHQGRANLGPGTWQPEAAHHPADERPTSREVADPNDLATSQEAGHQHKVPANLTGLIEYANATAIKGWVWDSYNPTRRVHLELVEAGVPLAAAVADIERKDLSDIGVGDGRHGFVIELAPGVIRDGEVRVLGLRCTSTGAAVPGSPITVTPKKIPFEWCIDSVSDVEITGRLTVRDDLTRHCVVVLREGGRAIAKATASLFRRDLLTAGVGDGCYGFSLQIPHSLLDGEEHLLEVIEGESGFALTEQPIRWRPSTNTVDTKVEDFRTIVASYLGAIAQII